MHTDIQVSSEIRTHDPSVRAGEDRVATVIGNEWITPMSLPVSGFSVYIRNMYRPGLVVYLRTVSEGFNIRISLQNRRPTLL
jgi:hypothetical protein